MLLTKYQSFKQTSEGGSRPSSALAHHLSLPTSSAELSAMEHLLQFPDSVPLKIRAKRGCATHPRSIAERVTSEYHSFPFNSSSRHNSYYLC